MNSTATPETALRRIRATVVRVMFTKDDYSVFSGRVRLKDNRSVVMTITAPTRVAEGQDVVIDGKVVRHPKFGQQFQGQTLVHYVPRNAEGILAFLSSGLIKGVGKKYAGLIVEAFGDDTMKVIEKEPHRLEGVKGIGKKRAQTIAKAVVEQRSYMMLLAYFKPLGVGNATAMKVFKEFGPSAVQVAKTDPYRITAIPGIGFLTADLLARNTGIAPDDPTRIRAAALHVLDETCQINGHTWLSVEDWVSSTRALLVDRIDTPALVTPQIVGDFLQADPELRKTIEIESGPDGNGDYVAPRRLRHYECVIAKALYERSIEPCTAVVRPHPGYFESLSPSQRTATQVGLSKNTVILTGGPGTGKTTTAKALIASYTSSTKPDGSPWRIELAATTGKAAKRAEEATGLPAQTVHRLFGFGQRESSESQRGWKYHSDNPLPADLVIIDETSMLDTYLASVVLSGLAPATRLLMIGDADQLPSVGPGKVLRDLIDSDRVTVARLTEVHRQAEGSLIINAAHSINAGRVPLLPKANQSLDNLFDQDAAMIISDEADQVLAEIIRVVEAGVKTLGADAVQILSPMRRGPIGTEAINRAVQAIFNPGIVGATKLIRIGGMEGTVGDRVMQTRNDYTNMIFNGDTGYIRAIADDDGWVEIDFEGRSVQLNTSTDLTYLEMAYASTVHKSQGSEYQMVVMPISTSHFIMLSRENVYTGITRSKRYCVLVGTEKALGIAVRKVGEKQRQTALPLRIEAMFKNPSL